MFDALHKIINSQVVNFNAKKLTGKFMKVKIDQILTLNKSSFSIVILNFDDSFHLKNVCLGFIDAQETTS